MNNKENPLVSICIPVFNGENFIFFAIKSVLEQNYPNYELLIVDNCSVDNTEEIIKQFSDKRIKYLKNQNNIGALRNFKKCVDLACGEYFVLLPHDDSLLPGFIDIYVDKLKKYEKVGMVYSSVQVVNETGDKIRLNISNEKDQIFTDEQALVEVFDNFFPVQLAMVRTDILRSVGNFEPKYGLFTDVQMWLKLMFSGWSVIYLNKPYSNHRLHNMQGQNAFLNYDLNTLEDHWAKKLDQNFWRKNSYNYFFIVLVCFIVDNYNKSEMSKKIIINQTLNLFIESHVRSLLYSLVKRNFFIFKNELSLFLKIIDIYPVSQIVISYIFGIIYFFLKKIFRLFFK